MHCKANNQENKKHTYSLCNLSDRTPYFFDYEYLQNGSDQVNYGRDYFIVPTEVLLAIAGYQDAAPSELLLRSEATMRRLDENLHKHKWAYCPAEGERITSVDQAWVAVMLKFGSCPNKGISKGTKLKHMLFKERKDNRLTDVALPLFGIFGVIAATVSLEWSLEEQAFWQRMVVQICGIIIAALYGLKPIRKLFSGLALARE
ncbi:MAG: hypothetical protein IIA14_00005 [SAR324 cluster bacterium]|nr:hypothetical protein [SAR324 cluster bacterium]